MPAASPTELMCSSLPGGAIPLVAPPFFDTLTLRGKMLILRFCGSLKIAMTIRISSLPQPRPWADNPTSYVIQPHTIAVSPKNRTGTTLLLPQCTAYWLRGGVSLLTYLTISLQLYVWSHSRPDSSSIWVHHQICSNSNSTFTFSNPRDQRFSWMYHPENNLPSRQSAM